jgi:site-specific recombinase
LRKVFGFFRKTRGLFRFRPPESDLSYLFSQPAKGESLEASISWLHQLVRWIRLPSAISGIRTRKAELKTVRLRFILQHLARNEEWRSNFSQYIKIILTQTSGIHLFAESGLMQEDSLVGETINRFLKATLPVAPNAEDLADALAKIFLVESDVDWVRTISTDEDQLRQIFQSLSFSSEERFRRI